MDRPCFSHGQLYVAFSRVSDPSKISVFLKETTKKDGSTEWKHGKQHGCYYTRNDVYQTLLSDEIEKMKESQYCENGPDEFCEGKNTVRVCIKIYLR